MADPGFFPLLVEGSWGPDPPKNLTTKLQMYFQSQKKSGGGECEVRPDPENPARFRVLFHLQDVQQSVLERKNHELVWPGKGTFKLTVQLPASPYEVHRASAGNISTKESKTKEHAKKPDASEATEVEDTPKECESVPSVVAFENLKANVTETMLTLLVENVSDLSGDDFQVEIMRDFDVAVVTFWKYIDAAKFVGDCTMHRSVRKLQLSPRLLEATKTIRVENLPPGVDHDNLKCFFEDPQNGGGRVVHVDYFPEESSALIKFFDRKVLDTILTKKLDLNNMPLSVFLYYESLGTALYGEEKPQVKLPAPFRESLDLFLWKFLHKRNHLIEEINEEVRRCHCELTWSQLTGEVTVRPAATLVNQGRQRIKTWKEDASALLACIKSRYKVTPLKVGPAVWGVIKNSVEDERLMIEYDTLMEIVTLVGKAEDVQNTEPHVKELIEKAIQKIEREAQSLKEKVAVSPGKYSLLRHTGVRERLRSEYPEMEIFYDEATQHVCFKGLGLEVYKAKCEIQHSVYTMAQKVIQLQPEVSQFLQQVDCAEFSKSLFIAQKIPAVYEPEGTAVLLTSCSAAALSEAEKHMVSALSYRSIDVESRELLDGKKWKVITGNLLKRHNSSSKTVIIKELASETTPKVVIAGFVKEVHEVYSVLFDFVEKNLKIERFTEIKPPLVIDYLKAEKKLFLQKIKKINVRVDFNTGSKTKGILLTGSKADVLLGVNILSQARDSVCVKSILVDKPGARQLFQERQRHFKHEVRSCGCFVELLQNEEQESGGADGRKCFSRTELAPGVSLIVQQGDLTQFPVEVVVNSANEDLRHGGGLAAALSKAAGPELQADCDQIVKKIGRIPPGQVTASKAGKLPYLQVIHAVGPRWKSDNAQECVSQLRSAVVRSLHLAERSKCGSIAIPAISSGVFGFPLSQCVETIVLAIKEALHDNRNGSLKEIYLVDACEKTVQAFAETVKTVFKNPTPGPASQPSGTVQAGGGVQPGPRRDDRDRLMLLCPGGLRMLLVKEGVQNATTDVVVNSIPSDLELNSGPLSQALLGKAGPDLQKELHTVAQGLTVDVGTILPTSGCHLHCQKVLHVVAPEWRSDTSSHKIMEDIIRKCLETTESLSLESITFPAIGTGNLRFPKAIFADLIISEVFKFSSNNQPKSLQEVCFLLHPSDHGNIQAFSDAFDRWADGNFVSDQTPKAPVAHGTVSSPAAGVHEMRIGPITFQVAPGDITKEEADVIVNSTSQTFNLKAGVSKAILEQAGQNVEKECTRLGRQGKQKYIVTEGGSLKCKNIIHVVGGNDVKTSVSCILQECENRNYSSICLPAIGTGNANQDPNKVAEAIIDAIEDFTQKGSVQSVKKVKVVIFLPQVLNVFYAALKKRESTQASPRQSVVSKIASFFGLSKQTPKQQKPLVLEKKAESVIFQVCGENETCVDNALACIQELLKKEQSVYSSEDECIKEFDEKEYQELKKLQNLNIALCVDPQRPLIEVAGMIKDVEQARNAIEEVLRAMRAAKDQESRADYISDFVEWQYNDNNMWHCFHKMTNLQLEDARKKQKNTVDVKINNQSHTVDLKALVATDAKGHSVPVQRLTKSEVEIPAHWSDMKQQDICLVTLQPAHAEYKKVADAFSQSCPSFRIEKIERIQNLRLWKLYQTQKKNMDEKNRHIENEQLLFHGTDANSLPYVNKNGFNRSYAGKNATAFGKGTYFAVSASYSASNTYSTPDASGKKHVYYVRVLTGLYTVGNRSLLVPPPKNPQDPTDLYDTVTDNMQNPSLFVVFYDNQTYPEYLITFQ